MHSKHTQLLCRHLFNYCAHTRGVTGVVPVLIYFFVKIFLNDRSCSAILLRVQRLHISSNSAGTVKFFLSSHQHHSFSLLGTASRPSLGLETLQSLKLIGMWSLTIHPDCLMNFLAAASGAIGSPSRPTYVIMNHPSSFFVGPHFVFFCCDDDLDGYKKTFIVFIYIQMKI